MFNKLINDMSIHAQMDFPAESCGIITTDFLYIPCENIALNKKESFILDPLSLLEHEDYIWGIFHSHPGSENPMPSEEDMAHTIFDEYKFVVGFANKYFIYWYDKKLEVLRYEPFEKKHCQ